MIFLSRMETKRYIDLNKRLSNKLKTKYLPILLERDGGFHCWYCKNPLDKTNNWIFEHLDNDTCNNSLENMVLSCQSCNNKKPHDSDLQILAQEKKEQNEKSNFMWGREKEEANAPTLSVEMDANHRNFDISHQFLSEIVETDGSIEYKDALDSITMRCKKVTGFGSQVSIRRHLDALTSREGNFMIAKNDEKKRIIVKRQGK